MRLAAGLRPGPLGERSSSPRPLLAAKRGPTSKGRERGEGGRKREGRGGKEEGRGGKRGEERGKEGKGKGGGFGRTNKNTAAIRPCLQDLRS